MPSGTAPSCTAPRSWTPRCPRFNTDALDPRAPCSDTALGGGSGISHPMKPVRFGQLTLVSWMWMAIGACAAAATVVGLANEPGERTNQLTVVLVGSLAAVAALVAHRGLNSVTVDDDAALITVTRWARSRRIEADEIRRAAFPDPTPGLASVILDLHSGELIRCPYWHGSLAPSHRAEATEHRLKRLGIEIHHYRRGYNRHS